MGDTPEATDRQTTTIQITHEIWAALDRRKDRGESFDGVIRRLIEATGIGVGALEGPHPEIEYGDVEPIPDDHDPDRGCVHYDVITGEQCDADPEYQQWYDYPDSAEGDGHWFYYCDEHVPESA